MDYQFCTLFDRNYLHFGLSLYRSLERCEKNFTLWILCMDQTTYRILQQMHLPKVKLVSHDKEFINITFESLKKQRSVAEYSWTCGSNFTWYVLNKQKKLNHIFYLDSDLFFFNSLDSVMKEIKSSSIAIIPHRYPQNNNKALTSGIFNVGMIYFKRDQEGISCLRRWKNQCIDWCYNRLEDNKFGDQLYLNQWPHRYKNLCVIQHKGANLAPWNINNYRLTEKNGKVFVDSDPLIFYHFHSLKLYDKKTVKLANDEYTLTPLAVEYIYQPYLDEIKKSRQYTKKIQPDFDFGFFPPQRSLIGKIISAVKSPANQITYD